jgi:hypothetical protein
MMAETCALRPGNPPTKLIARWDLHGLPQQIYELHCAISLVGRSAGIDELRSQIEPLRSLPEKLWMIPSAFLLYGK